MKTGLKEALIFLSGAAIGGFSSWFVCKKHYEKKAEEEIASVEKAFTDRLNELEDEKEEALDIASNALINSNGYNKDNPGSKEFLRNKSTLEGFVKTANAERIDYTKAFDKNSKETIEVDGVPSDDSAEETHKSGDIYEIPYDKYGTKPGWDVKEIYYYIGDGVVVDDDEQFIDNPDYLLGNVIETSGFNEDGVRNIYIRNEKISTDFEVMKIDGSYA